MYRCHAGGLEKAQVLEHNVLVDPVQLAAGLLLLLVQARLLLLL
jgi:hypothetical protein